jgi:hypothetical protein
MPSITQRSTKAELLAAYQALQATQADGPSWGQVAVKAITTAQVVSRETVALVKDCYNAGSLLRQWVSGIAAELSRPVLRSKA